MTRATFDLIKEKYGYYSSWAIWADAGEKPKSNIGDLRVFNMDANPSVLGELKPHIVEQRGRSRVLTHFLAEFQSCQTCLALSC